MKYHGIELHGKLTALSSFVIAFEAFNIFSSEVLKFGFWNALICH